MNSNTPENTPRRPSAKGRTEGAGRQAPRRSSGVDKARMARVRKWVKWGWIALAVPFVVLGIMLLFTSLGLFGKLPSFEELENPKSNIATEIYSEDGSMIGSFFIQNRSYVDYEELPQSLVAALVSTEDARYYSHSGIDFVSLARVGVKTLALGNHSQGGGSTITQQLAKNLFPRDTVSYSSVARKMKLVQAKLKEWITALKLEYGYTKEEIVAMYLNTVAFGSNAYGIRSAARTFFNKTPSELSIQESALLVGVVNAPSRYSPVRNYDRALARRNTVLTRMKANGYLTQSQCDSLRRLPIELDYRPISHNEGRGTYFREMLRLVMTAEKPQRRRFANDWDYEQELARWENDPLYGWCHKNRKADGSPYNIYRDGLKIYTTLNASMQRYAEEAVQEQLEKSIQPAMDRQVKNSKVLFINTSKADVENIVMRAMRQSDRYRELAKQGLSRDKIVAEFDKPVQMRIFTFGGEVDTLMTPRDSILHHKRIMRASLMSVDPATGYVKAYVGGPNFRYFKYDMVKQGKRQPGSTMKPFVYTFAIDHLGFTPCTMVPNLPVTIETDTGTPWSPKEAGKVEYDGVLHPLRWGLARSRNNYSAWIMKQAKQPATVADFIHDMGIHSFIDPVYALCLGTSDVTLFEMTGAFATFANRGVHIEPLFVTRIEDRQGNIISSFISTSTDAISEETAYTMLTMLQGVVTSGTAGRLRYQYGMMGEIGGKTGTSQENRDAWFMGVTPRLVTGVWVGGEDQSVHLRTAGEGSVVALPIFGEYMKRVYADQRLGIRPGDTFARPNGWHDYSCSDDGDAGAASASRASDEDEFFN